MTYSNDIASHVDNVDPRGGYSYGELKDFMELYWYTSLTRCLRKGDLSPMAKFMTDDVELIRPIIGIEPPFFNRSNVVKGKDEVMRVITEENVLGIPGWTYPLGNFGYNDDSGIGVIIDSRKAVILYKVNEISPYQKKDGTPFRNPQFGTIRLHYSGSYQVNKIVDISEKILRMRVKEEIITAGLAPKEMIDEVNAYYAQCADDAEKWTAYIKKLYEASEHPDRDESDKARFYNYLDNEATWRGKV